MARLSPTLEDMDFSRAMRELQTGQGTPRSELARLQEGILKLTEEPFGEPEPPRTGTASESRCRCARYPASYACTSPITQEDLLCDACRDGKCWAGSGRRPAPHVSAEEVRSLLP